MRLDQYVATKLNLSRNRAQFLIDEKLVKVNSQINTKSSLNLKGTDIVEIIEDKKVEYVARSALKLDAFLNEIDLQIEWKMCLDAGASTGWFTQILLERWANKVIAVDVWTSQLHEKIRSDSRVISIENTDIRDFKIENLSTLENSNLIQYFDIIVADLSFISLHKIIDNLKNLSWTNTNLVLLFKPQFEVGRINLKKTWVPKDEKVIAASLEKFKIVCKETWFWITKISESKLPGEAWNKEYFILLKLARNS